MRYLTLKNVERATELIMAKGYSREEANDMAINCFAMVNQFSNSVEFYINKIISKEEHEDRMLRGETNGSI